MDPDDKICYCFHVTQRKITNFIRLEQPLVPSQLSECGGAGTGCGWCVPFLRKCFDAADRGEQAGIGISPDEYEAQRKGYIAAGKRR